MARPEVTGKKLPSPAPFQLGAYTIETFCAAHGLSPAMYFKLRKAGLGPDEMEMGRRKGISIESAAKWRRKREAAAKRSLAREASAPSQNRRQDCLPEPAE
jgi:hypothetical protein